MPLLMTDNNGHSAVLAARDQYLKDRGWQRHTCSACGGVFFSKKPHTSCGSYRCEGGYRFLGYPSPKNPPRLRDLALEIHNLCTSTTAVYHEPIAIFRRNERTLFASTAGQVFDRAIYGPDRLPAAHYVVLQPVIRLQGKDLVGDIDGFSTSFLHLASEGWKLWPDAHYNTLDNWFDALSRLGLYVGNLRLKAKTANNDWAGMPVTSEMLTINYAGLELGVANYFFNIPTASGIAVLSDIGFGAERLLWALNRHRDGYWHVFTPPGMAHGTVPHRCLDAIRTATLMAGSGTVPGPRGHGSKLVSLIARFACQAWALNLHEIVRFHHDQWGNFRTLPVCSQETYGILWRECLRRACEE